jgi:hypothetical protein
MVKDSFAKMAVAMGRTFSVKVGGENYVLATKLWVVRVLEAGW